VGKAGTLARPVMSKLAKSSLTGVWDGLYSYPRRLKPVAFTAVLFESGSSVSGATHETAEDGPHAGQMRCASIDGDRTGQAVDFVKIYDDIDAGTAKPIVYSGALNADATEIEGRWSITGSWSGKFLMIRSQGSPEAIEARWNESIPAA
jgi:hypothetical protein